MKLIAFITAWVVLIAIAGLPAAALAKGCKGCSKHFTAYAPVTCMAVAEVSPGGVMVEMQLPPGPLGNYRITYHCDCVAGTGGALSFCNNYTEVEYGVWAAGEYESDSGGCEWDNHDGERYCFDVSCGNSGEDPVLIGPHQQAN